MLGVEDFPAGEAVADEFVFVEGPDDLAVLVEFDDLGIFITGVAVADDEVAVGEFLKVGGPGKFDVGSGDLFRHFPDHSFAGRDFENGVATAGGDEGVPVFEADRSEDAGVGGVFPNDFAGGVILGDDAGVFGAREVVAVGENLEHAGLVAAVLGKGDFLDDLAAFVEVDNTANPALGDHGIAVGKTLEGMDVGAFGIVFPNDFLFRCDLGCDGPRVVEENVSVFEELDIVMARVIVRGFGATGFVLPDDSSVGLADCEDVFAVGSTDEDEAIFFGKEGERREEEGSE